jgi:hypothetical protein
MVPYLDAFGHGRYLLANASTGDRESPPAGRVPLKLRGDGSAGAVVGTVIRFAHLSEWAVGRATSGWCPRELAGRQ